MSREEFLVVCKRLRGHTDQLLLHVMGEPLLHPELDQILSLIEEYGFKVSITTNGTLIKEKADILLAHSNAIHRVSISLHAIEGNAIESLDSKEYLDSVISFASMAAGREINVALRLWNLDTDERAGANSNNEFIVSEVQKRFPEPWEKRYSGYRIAYRIFLEYDGIFTWPSESDEDPRNEGYCHALSRQIAILADGTVVPCCLDSEGQMALGNIFENDLSEILASPRAKNMIIGFAKRELKEPLCRTCSYSHRFDKSKKSF
jgi:radical SAM protein with 4Fe4S-binding SPASM domain